MTFGKKKERRTARVEVRFTTAEKDAMDSLADEANLTVSDFMRRAALGKKILSQGRLNIIQEVAALRNEIKKLGGMVKHLHNTNDGIYSKETAAMLQASALAIENVNNAITAIAQDTEED